MIKRTHKKSTIISDGSDKPAALKGKHYVSNPDLLKEFEKWYAEVKLCEELGEDAPILPNTIGQAFIQIAENLAKKSNWLSNSRWKQEMVGDAIENCCRYASNFNPEISKNPFAYFTQCCYYAFLRRIRIEKTSDYIKHKTMLNSMSFQELSENIEDDINIDVFDYNQEGIEAFIKDFEIKTFGAELRLDESAGIAGKRRAIKSSDISVDNMGFF